MAKVKITGHASGSGVITVTAPNTSTDRTITLPDATATLATTAEAFNPDAAQVFNESGADVDFRVESDTITNALFVDGAKGNVGMGVVPASDWVSGQTALQIGGTGSISSLTIVDDDQLHLNNNCKQTASSISTGWKYIRTDKASQHQQSDGTHTFKVAASGSADSAITWTDALKITNDGRGLSQFTAKAWINFNGQNTVAIRDSHNVSSITDNGTGSYNVTMTNAMANVNYCVTAVSGRGNGEDMHALVPQSNFNFTTTQFRILTLQSWDVAHDASYVGATVFGD
jgi:hypothetical protein